MTEDSGNGKSDSGGKGRSSEHLCLCSHIGHSSMSLHGAAGWGGLAGRPRSRARAGWWPLELRDSTGFISVGGGVVAAATIGGGGTRGDGVIVVVGGVVDDAAALAVVLNPTEDV